MNNRVSIKVNLVTVGLENKVERMLGYDRQSEGYLKQRHSFIHVIPHPMALLEELSSLKAPSYCHVDGDGPVPRLQSE